MSYDPRYKKVKASGAKIPWIVLGILNVICMIAIVYIWHIYSGKIFEAGNGLLKSKKSTDVVIKDQPDTVGENGGETVYNLVDDMIQFARPEEETKTKTSSFVKDQLDTVSEFGGEKIGELVDHMVKSARPNDEEKAREEAEAAARRARERKLSELKQRKKQLDSKIAAADSRHRMATRTVPFTPVFETTDSDSTRRISAQQRALKEKLRSEADEAGQELRKLQIERQHIIHEISKLEK